MTRQSMRSMWMLVVLASVVACTVPAGAVIELQFTLADMIRDSQTVLVGTIAAIRPEVNLLEVKPDLAAKGTTSPARSSTVQIMNHEVLLQAAVGQPLVLFVGRQRKGPARRHRARGRHLAAGRSRPDREGAHLASRNALPGARGPSPAARSPWPPPCGRCRPANPDC